MGMYEVLAKKASRAHAQRVFSLLYATERLTSVSSVPYATEHPQSVSSLPYATEHAQSAFTLLYVTEHAQTAFSLLYDTEHAQRGRLHSVCVAHLLRFSRSKGSRLCNQSTLVRQ